MKALTIQQPWATLLACGATRYSVRTWRTRYRGPLALHAGRSLGPDAIEICLHEEVRPALKGAGYDYIVQLPRHAVVGFAHLVACIRAGEARPHLLNWQDLALRLNDVPPERWVWVFAQPQMLARPVPHRGRPGLFDVADTLLREACLATASGAGR